MIIDQKSMAKLKGGIYMRVSINITAETKSMIKEIKKEKFAGKRVTDGYIINMVMNDIPIENLEKKLFEIKETKASQSIKYTLDRQTNEKINKINIMKSVTKDMIINTGLMLYKEKLKNEAKLKKYKRRYELIMNKSRIKIVDNNLLDILPGIYSVWISAMGKEEKEILYVGKSELIHSRQMVHLYSLLDDPGYFGLIDEDLKNPKLQLGFKIEHLINLNKVNTFQELKDSLIEKEKEHIKKLKPHTQKNMIMKNDDEKREAVKKVIENLLK